MLGNTIPQFLRDAAFTFAFVIGILPATDLPLARVVWLQVIGGKRALIEIRKAGA